MEKSDRFKENLKHEFQVETLEHLELVEKELILYEKQPTVDGIARIFRSIHSIKGCAGFLAYRKITNVAHHLETLLQLVRSQATPPEKETINTLLAGADLLKKMITDPASGEGMDIAPIIHRTSDAIRAISSPQNGEAMEHQIPLRDVAGQETGFNISEFKLKFLSAEYQNLYLLSYDLHRLQQQQGTSPLSLILHLTTHGMIVDTRMETMANDFDQDFSAMPLMYQVCYATALTPEALTGAAELKPSQLKRMIKQPAAAPAVHRQADSETEIQPQTATCHSEYQDLPDTVRLRVEILDKLMKLAGELVLVRNNLIAAAGTHHAIRGISQRLNTVTSEIQETIMQTRLQPIGKVFAKLPRLVRDTAASINKKIEIRISGDDVELDKTIVESLSDPLVHIVRNCCDHGIELPEERKKIGKPLVGRIEVHAWHEAGQINIRIRDDGKGLNPELIRRKALETGIKTEETLAGMNNKELLSLVLISGFTTTIEANAISGRGVGMDVVKAGVERLGGSIEIDSRIGQGAEFHLRLPLTLAIIPCFIVMVGDERYAIPQVNVLEMVCLYHQDVYLKVEIAGDQEVYRLRERLLPLVRMEEALKRPKRYTPLVRAEIARHYAEKGKIALQQAGIEKKTLNFAVVKAGSKQYGLVVDRVLGVEEIVVNAMHPALKTLKIYSGATVMGDGAVALILDVEGLHRHADVQFNLIQEEGRAEDRQDTDEVQTVLLFKHGPHEQFAVPLSMIRRVEHINLSHIQRVGDREFITIDNKSIMILRLDRYLKVSPCIDLNTALLLLPKHLKNTCGILATQIVDTTETPLQLNTDNYMETGLLGNSVIRDRLTLFIDIYRLLEKAEPEWFLARKREAPSPAGKKRILLVEDAPFFRHLVKGYLESDGYETTIMENGSQAASALAEKDFDLIVSDLDMPVMDGWTLMEFVRQQSRCPNIPAVALTALDSEDDREKAMSAGFNAYQVKLDREALLTTISRLLQNTQVIPN